MEISLSCAVVGSKVVAVPKLPLAEESSTEYTLKKTML